MYLNTARSAQIRKTGKAARVATTTLRPDPRFPANIKTSTTPLAAPYCVSLVAQPVRPRQISCPRNSRKPNCPFKQPFSHRLCYSSEFLPTKEPSLTPGGRASGAPLASATTWCYHPINLAWLIGELWRAYNLGPGNVRRRPVLPPSLLPIPSNCMGARLHQPHPFPISASALSLTSFPHLSAKPPYPNCIPPSQCLIHSLTFWVAHLVHHCTTHAESSTQIENPVPPMAQTHLPAYG